MSKNITYEKLIHLKARKERITYKKFIRIKGIIRGRLIWVKSNWNRNNLQKVHSIKARRNNLRKFHSLNNQNITYKKFIR